MNESSESSPASQRGLCMMADSLDREKYESCCSRDPFDSTAQNNVILPPLAKRPLHAELKLGLAAATVPFIQSIKVI